MLISGDTTTERRSTIPESGFTAHTVRSSHGVCLTQTPQCSNGDTRRAASVALYRHPLFIYPDIPFISSFQRMFFLLIRYFLSHTMSADPSFLQITIGFPSSGLISGVVDRCTDCLICLCMSCAHDYRSLLTSHTNLEFKRFRPTVSL